MTQRQREQVDQFLKNIKSKLNNEQLGASEEVLGENPDRYAIESLIEALSAKSTVPEEAELKSIQEDKTAMTDDVKMLEPKEDLDQLDQECDIKSKEPDICADDNKQ